MSSSAGQEMSSITAVLEEEEEEEEERVEGSWIIVVRMLPPLQRGSALSCLCSALQQAVTVETAVKASIETAYTAG